MNAARRRCTKGGGELFKWLTFVRVAQKFKGVFFRARRAKKRASSMQFNISRYWHHGDLRVCISASRRCFGVGEGATTKKENSLAPGMGRADKGWEHCSSSHCRRIDSVRRRRDRKEFASVFLLRDFNGEFLNASDFYRMTRSSNLLLCKRWIVRKCYNDLYCDKIKKSW